MTFCAIISRTGAGRRSGSLVLLGSSRTRTEIKLNHLELLAGEIEAELDAMMASGILAATVEPTKP